MPAIPNHWYAIEISKEVKTRPTSVRRFGVDLVLWRDEDGAVRCFVDRCPHRAVALSAGRVVQGNLECPYHGFRFEPSGACVAMPCEGDTTPPAKMRATRLACAEKNGLIWIWWGDSDQVEGEPVWPEAFPTDPRGTAGSSEVWPIPFERTVESNFDVSHTPFVHKNVIWGLGARVDPIDYTLDDEVLEVFGSMGDAKKPFSFRITFRAPGTTTLEFGDNYLGIVLDCPIDETSTWRYARFSARFGFALVNRVASWLLLQLEWRLVQGRQDLPIVKTMQPTGAGPVDDRLVRADLGIAQYRRLMKRRWKEVDLDALPAFIGHAPTTPAGHHRLPVLAAEKAGLQSGAA